MSGKHRYANSRAGTYLCLPRPVMVRKWLEIKEFSLLTKWHIMFINKHDVRL